MSITVSCWVWVAEDFPQVVELLALAFLCLDSVCVTRTARAGVFVLGY